MPQLQQSQDNGDVTGYRIEYAIDVATDDGAYQEVLATAFRRQDDVRLCPLASHSTYREPRKDGPCGSVEPRRTERAHESPTL